MNRPPSVPAAMWKSNDGMYTSHVSDCNKDRRKITMESVKTAISRQTKGQKTTFPKQNLSLIYLVTTFRVVVRLFL